MASKLGVMGIGRVKPEIRIAGFDDAPFGFRDSETRLVCTIFRGGLWMDGVLMAKVQVDGLDSTNAIIRTINGSSHREQLRVIMLDGITFGGFNIADIGRLGRETGLPVIAVVRDRPDFGSIRKALGRFGDAKKRWGLVEKAGPVKPLEVRDPKTGNFKSIWFQTSGIEDETARKIIRVSSTRSFTPEPLRVAHLIGQGLGGLR